ncbi:MAG: hypothetical protein DCF30_11940 [Hyphomicrobiales bacterium]|nr:MAG: hypothetical protein DCF30_11940 [Hyphomicrobiales bacterium]
MIHESAPWKAQLRRDADLLERWASKPSCTERRSFLIEKKLFLAAYAMRKLDEASKLSSALLAANVDVLRFRSNKPGYDQLNSHRFDEFFSMGEPELFKLSGRRLLNLLIHSFVFVEVIGQNDICEGFMVTSDYELSRGLVQVEMRVFVELMRTAASDNPSAMRYTRDAKTGRWVIWTGHELPPETP